MSCDSDENVARGDHITLMILKYRNSFIQTEIKGSSTLLKAIEEIMKQESGEFCNPCLKPKFSPKHGQNSIQ